MIKKLNDKIDLMYLGLAMNNICVDCFQPLEKDEIHPKDECDYNLNSIVQLQKDIGMLDIDEEENMEVGIVEPSWVKAAWEFLNSSNGEMEE